jgi:cysteine-rich repeat protein
MPSSSRLLVSPVLAALCLAFLASCAGGKVGAEMGGSDESDTMVTGSDESEGDGDGDPSDTADTSSDSSACTEVGCECDGGPDSCNAGLACVDGSCQSPTCGNEIVEQPAEECDDGNEFEGDGCDNDCSLTALLDVDAGRHHTCALLEGGRVRCWGNNSGGQLGYGNVDNIGDNELASAPGDVVLGEAVLGIDVGGGHACAQLESGNVRCWGNGTNAQLGYGNVNSIGDDEFPFSVNPISINAEVIDIVGGGRHTCVRVGAGNVRCWGTNDYGQLGYGNTTQLSAPLTIDLNLGALALFLRAGEDHNCAVLDDGALRCWGRNDYGQLGYGNTTAIGDTETPGSVVPVPLLPQGIPNGTAVVEAAIGHSHTCVIFETGSALCWGDNFYGQLGQGTTNTVGDNETLATLFPIDIGADVTQIVAGRHHTCALLDDGGVKCWGRNLYGQLGYGNIAHVGDDEVPADLPTIDLGGPAQTITAGDYHTCALLDEREILCWGLNDYGQLGYGDTLLRGDDESPVDAGPVPVL